MFYLFSFFINDVSLLQNAFCRYSEASVPEVNLTFKANLEATSDTCNRLSHFVNVGNLTDSVLSQCPSSCNCTPGDLKPSYMGDNECLVELPVTLECGGYGLAKQIAMLWSMMHVPGAMNEDITITKYPSITDIKETCSEGWSLHTQEGADPVCSKLTTARGTT